MRRQDLSYPVSIENLPSKEAFRHPVFFRFDKQEHLSVHRFVQHGSGLVRIKVRTQRVLRDKLSNGLIMLAARYAAARGWKTVHIVQDEYRGWQSDNKLTYLNVDQAKNIRHYESWTHKRPIYDLEEIQRYLNP